MVGTLVPERLKRFVNDEVLWRLRVTMPTIMPDLMQWANYIPHQPESGEYVVTKSPGYVETHPASPFPIPPQDLWVRYGGNAAEYLESGREDVAKMRELLAATGAPAERAGRILEFGCAAGRMIRWLDDLPKDVEIWGADIWATAILWCKQCLTPRFNFVTTTVVPHLPFEDRYFGLIYAGSVFTHIDDMADAWFLELRRILRPGGRLYITILDRAAMKVFDGEVGQADYERYYKRTGGESGWRTFVSNLEGATSYRKFRGTDFGMFTIDRALRSNVFYDADYLCTRLAPMFRTLKVADRAYGHQTVLVLERI